VQKQIKTAERELRCVTNKVQQQSQQKEADCEKAAAKARNLACANISRR
jgi:hypothetical protein